MANSPALIVKYRGIMLYLALYTSDANLVGRGIRSIGLIGWKVF